MLDAIAKGARKPGARLAGVSEPMSAAVLHMAEGRRVPYVIQAQPVTSFPGLRADYGRLSCGLSLMEIAAAVLPHHKPCSEEFHFLVRALRFLEVHERPVVVYAWSLVRLMELSGFQPQFNRCVADGGQVRESRPSVSAAAGGYVMGDHVHRYPDSFTTRPEVLYGLAKLAECPVPPPTLKFAEESALVLIRLWRSYAECALPATEACAADLATRSEQGVGDQDS